MEHTHETHMDMLMPQQNRRKLRDFLPLAIIFVVILLLTAVTASFYGGDTFDVLRLFMGYFFLVFGAFKVINLRGFADAYGMYDVIAKRSRFYAYLYPFIELALAAAYLSAFKLLITNWVTLVIMLVSAFGVYLKIREKEEVPCACLGTVFKLPMTRVTLTEDLLMAGMAIWMIVLLS